MNIELPNGASGFYPAPTNHISGDPTPLDQAVYIPSVSPHYAIAAYEQQWQRPLPKGVDPEDLNFLDPANKLFRISHVMSSAGQALNQKRPCIIQERDRSATMMIADSGGYQIASGNLKIRNDQDRLQILRWQEKHADWAMTLDVPTGPLLGAGYAYSSFRHCLDTTLSHLEFYQRHRNHGATKFLNVLQGNDTRETDAWYEAVKDYEFEGWAFAGKLRHNFFNLCRRIIKMADENKIQDKNWIHVLGTCELEPAVGLTALQRAINKYINPHLRISYDTSTPFRMLGWSTAYSIIKFDAKGMSLSSPPCPDGDALINSPVRFPWSSPLGDKMTLGDICVGNIISNKHFRDQQSGHYLCHHNLASLCHAVAEANRIFDSESIVGQHTISRDMGYAVAAINNSIKAGTLTELERYRSTFNRVRPVEKDADIDADRHSC